MGNQVARLSSNMGEEGHEQARVWSLAHANRQRLRLPPDLKQYAKSR